MSSAGKIIYQIRHSSKEGTMPELYFKGKEFVYNHHLTVPYRPLETQPDKSVGDDSGNLIIHGDNLHALKALLPHYAGKVDCIFIDPPYNTGNENWSYNDNVNSPIMREWLSTNPVNKEDMLRHDKWSCLMYPRLKMLNELLSEEGSFWMTLDDNEAHRARMLLDDIFGEDNFVAQVAWEKVYSPRMDADGFSKDYDTILVYAKDSELVRMNKARFSQNESQFTYLDPDTGKKARLRTLRKEGSNSLRTDRPNMWYPIEAPDGTQIWPIKPDGTEGCWRWGRTAYERESVVKPCRVLIQKSEKGSWEVLVKQYYEGDAERPPSTIFRHSEFGHTHEASEEIKAIFGKSAFQTPKPVRLIQGILEFALPEDGLVLDSFAGSGTTAHAVLALNAKDGGNRNFILVECEEYADTLTAERVRRVINGYEFEGTQREELFRKKVNFSTLKDAPKLLREIEHLEQVKGKRFDKISKTIKNDELLVIGEKKIIERTEGLGGGFTYCTLGQPLDLDKLLTGEQSPDYRSLGAWLFHTATGEPLSPANVREEEWYLGESPSYHVWLIYRPDLDWLKSRDAALTLTLAEKIAATDKEKRHLVFAPARFVASKHLLPLGVEHAPLPFALYRFEKD